MAKSRANFKLLIGTAMLLSCMPITAGELGQATVLSFLGQPLEARISINDTNIDELRDARVSLAPLTEWLRAGLPPLPEGMRVDVDLLRGTDQPYVLLRTREAITEPVLQLLVNLQLTSQPVEGKPFILFLDPLPSPGDVARAELSARQARNAQNTRSQNATPARVLTAPAAVSSTATASLDRTASPGRAAANTIDSEYGPVRDGETLWSIARSYAAQTGFSTQQVVMAIQQLNPGAFDDASNINTLRSGSVLDLPDTNLIARTDLDQAIARIREQNSAWQGGRLQILTAQNEDKIAIPRANTLDALEKARLEEALLAAQRENEALREQIVQLEDELDASEADRRQIENRVADLQQALETSESASAAFAAAIEEPQQTAVEDSSDNPVDTDTTGSDDEQATETESTADLGSDESDDSGTLADTVAAGQALVEQAQDNIPAGNDVLANAIAQAQNRLPDNDDEATETADEALDDSDDGRFVDAETDSTDESDNVSSPIAAEMADTEQHDSSTEEEAPVTPTAPASQGDWSWPLWESKGWRNLTGSVGFIPDGLMGFIAVIGTLVIAVLLLVAWLFSRRKVGDDEYQDMLDRLAERRTANKKSPEEATETAAAEVMEDTEPDEAFSPADAVSDNAAEVADVIINDSIIEEDTANDNEVLEGIDDGDSELVSDYVDSESTDSEMETVTDTIETFAQDAATDVSLELDTEVINGDETMQDAEETERLPDADDLGLDDIFSVDGDTVTDPISESGAIELDADVTEAVIDDAIDTLNEPVDDVVDFDIGEPESTVESAADDADMLLEADLLDTDDMDNEVAVDLSVNDVTDADDMLDDLETIDLDAELGDSSLSDGETLSEHSEADDAALESLSDELQDIDEPMDDLEQDDLFDDDDIEIKLDLARAYQSMGDREAMLTILDEIEGDLTDEQQDEIMRLRSDR